MRRTLSTHRVAALAATLVVLLGAAPPAAGSAEPLPAEETVPAEPPGEASVPVPGISVEPGELASSQEPDRVVSQELTIGNSSGGDLAWRAFEGEPAPRPTGPVTPVGPAGEPDGTGTGTLAPFRGSAGRPGWTVPLAPPAAPAGAVTLTHSGGYAVVAGAAVACSTDRGVTTTASGYLRHFTLTDFGIGGGFEVSAVSFAVESLTGAGTEVTVDLSVLADPAGPFRDENLQPVGTATVIPGPSRMVMLTVPVTGSVPAGATLVVEVSTPDLARGGFFVGAGPAGQSAPAYLRAAGCGAPGPTPLAALGLPDLAVVMGVTGTPEPVACQVPGGTSWMDLAPVSGAVPAGGAQPLVVSFDSTGLSPGDRRSADLCLVSGDPLRPVVRVPVRLEVVEPGRPVIEVSPAEVSATLDTGAVAQLPLTIGNTGAAELTWDLDPPGGPPADPRAELLAAGVLLVPESTGGRVMALDPATGDLIDPDFIPADPAADLGTPIEVVVNPAGDGFWLSDQLRHVVHGYDLAGAWQGTAAPAGGADVALAQNLRGIQVTGTGTLLVTVAAGANAGTVAEFDATGGYLGNLVPNRAGGLGGPWDLAPREADLLVSDDQVAGAGAIHRFDPDGSHAGIFHAPIGFPQQLERLANGNLLVAQFSSSGGLSSGVWELDPAGQRVAVYTGVTGNRGVHELPNGNILTTNGGGVHEISRSGGLVATKVAGVSARFITHVRLDDPGRCQSPAEVPWLEANPLRGTTAAGTGSEVALTLDATGLAGGEYRATLCVASNDPDRPVVPVPVTLTVDDGCDRTITGENAGPLTVTTGVTCLAPGARVAGEVNVLDGAGLVATGAVIQGPLASFGATTVEVTGTQIIGPVAVRGTTGAVRLTGNQVTGSMLVVANTTGATPIVIAGNLLVGSLFCTGNQPAPVNQGLPNTAVGGAGLHQCAGL